MLARNVVNSVCCTQSDACGRFPTMAPTRISTSATEMPSRMLINEATRASKIQTNATQ
jgi:hypothetical protein